jgi:hypothetical protein
MVSPMELHSKATKINDNVAWLPRQRRDMFTVES